MPQAPRSLLLAAVSRAAAGSEPALGRVLQSALLRRPCVHSIGAEWFAHRWLRR